MLGPGDEALLERAPEAGYAVTRVAPVEVFAAAGEVALDRLPRAGLRDPNGAWAALDNFGVAGLP